MELLEFIKKFLPYYPCKSKGFNKLLKINGFSRGLSSYNVVWFLGLTFGLCNAMVCPGIAKIMKVYTPRKKAVPVIRRVKARARGLVWENCQTLCKGKKRRPMENPEANPKKCAETSVFSPWLNRAMRVAPAARGTSPLNREGPVVCQAASSPAAPMTAVEAPMDSRASMWSQAVIRLPEVAAARMRKGPMPYPASRIKGAIKIMVPARFPMRCWALEWKNRAVMARKVSPWRIKNDEAPNLNTISSWAMGDRLARWMAERVTMMMRAGRA